MDEIIYVSYGSNLSSGRFKTYITGGTVEGNSREYLGCRNKKLHGWVKPYVLKGDVIMSQESKIWGGGVAFYNPEGDGVVFAAGYLITKEQFNDVLSQENGGEAGEISINFEELFSAGEVFIDGMYGRIIYLHDDRNIPLVTFTYNGDINDLVFNPASESYTHVIEEGLKETLNVDEVQLKEYVNHMNSDPKFRGTFNAAGFSPVLNA